MKLALNTPLQTLNKAFRKEKVSRDSFTGFNNELIVLIKRINEEESEEHLKYPLRDFLKNTFYSDHEINTKGKTDLGIYLDKTDKSKLGVIIETKKPSNLGDMITTADINKKAMHEAILYFLRERIDENNNEIKHIIITNIYEWFIFDAHDFERHFYKSNLTKDYSKWKAGQKTSVNTPLFYNEIAKPFLAECNKEISATYFDLRDYQKGLETSDTVAEKKLTALYKIFSGVTLLKESFANDSNSLDKRFYNELLHIIGLEEKKEGNKRTIKRKANPDHGSLIENTIATLEANEKLHRVENRERYGETKNDQLFNVALELVITWVNRILFLKLLEAQLVRYHQGAKEYKFLDSRFIADFDELNELFFEVLAKQEGDRKDYIKEKFRFIPYLNSSLFELKPGSLEDNTVLVSNLKGRLNLPITAQSVLRTDGRKRTSELPTLIYLFDFLDAYDFSTEGAEDIQEENKTLINASVLGLIFEKINGYKDGSFFTPGFITMYMCRETIRRTILQKFEEIKGWKCDSIEQLKDKIESRSEANAIINSLKICDPAVGSGHFLVSALNEIIAVKSELGILCYRNGNRIRNYTVDIANDEIIITDKETEDIFEYRLNEKGKPVDYLQELQEALFHEKETIIENCLFGVDINPNSVNICRLRLWIELLKNSYYTQDSGYTTLETLPNIDINIKCGNSLVSRFALDADLSKALKTIKYNIHTYRKCVVDYKNATNKADKRSLEMLIDQIKNDFRDDIQNNDPKIIRLKKVRLELWEITQQFNLFELTKDKKLLFDKKVSKLSSEQSKLENEITEIKNNIIYRNAFEWRFEFPEVLDDDGSFLGFDSIIGNPPYGAVFNKNDKNYIKLNYRSYKYRFDSYIYFLELGLKILRYNGFLDFITPILWLTLENCYPLRSIVLNENDFIRVYIHGEGVFDEAIVNTSSSLIKKSNPNNNLIIQTNNDSLSVLKSEWICNDDLRIETRFSKEKIRIVEKIKKNSKSLSDYGEVIQGITPYDKYRGQTKEIIESKAYHSNYKIDETYGKWLDGKDLIRYEITWNNKWLSYGDWLAAPREKKFFEGPRILFREIPGIHKRIQSATTDEVFYYGHSISPFKPFPENIVLLKYFLGLFNSKLISWYGQHVLPNFGKEVFPKLNPNDIKLLPVPNEIQFFNDVTNKVDSILMLKRNSQITDSTEHIEKEIDAIIYQLYGLTDEEIEIVESSFN